VEGELRPVRALPALAEGEGADDASFSWLNPPRTENEPVKLGRLGSSSGTATNSPVAVKPSSMRPSSKVVVCSTRLVVVVMV